MGLVGFVATFGNFGLDYALIQKGKAATDLEYHVAMSIRLLIGLALFSVTFFIAGPWSSLFGDALLAPATQVLSVLYLVGSWTFTPSVRISAELNYRKLISPNLAAVVTGSLVSLALAVVGFHVWALVYGALAAQAVGAITFAIVQPWRFRLVFDRRVALNLLAYSKHIILASIVGFLITNVDNFTVGYLLGSSVLGYYTVAYGLSLMSSQVSASAASALFPSFAQIQDDPSRLQRGYLESFGYACATVAPVAVGIAVTSPELVDVVLGSTWRPVVVPLAILAFYGLTKALSDFSSSLFAAVGKPRVIAELNVVVLSLSAVLLVPMTLALGISGAAIAMTVPMMVSFVVSAYRVSRILAVAPLQVALRGRGPIIAAGLMGGIVYLVKYVMHASLSGGFVSQGIFLGSNALALLVSVILGILLYFVFLRVIDRGVFRGLLRLTRTALDH